MRNGYKVWDTDTHCRPAWETLGPHFDAKVKARMPEFEKYKKEIKKSVEGLVAGNHGFALGARYPYPRFLGKAKEEPGLFRHHETIRDQGFRTNPAIQ